MELKELKQSWKSKHRSLPRDINYDSLRGKILSSLNQMSLESSNDIALQSDYTPFKSVYELGLGALTASSLCIAVLSAFHPIISLDTAVEIYSSSGLVSFLMW